MIKMTVSVMGMMCGMCEAHVNDAVSAAFKVKKVTSDYRKGETVIIATKGIEIDTLRKAIDKTGYRLIDVRYEPYEKRGFSLFGRKK